MFGTRFNTAKLKPNLKMAVNRLQIASNKKTALMKQQMREIASLLSESPPKEEKARIRAEALIRDDNIVEAYEILQLNCELLAERVNFISSEKTCPEDLKSCIVTLLWSSARIEIPELNEVRKQFRSKYGKQFDTDAMENSNGDVNERILARLSVLPPGALLVQTYLEKIASQFDVDWKPKEKVKPCRMSEPMSAPVGFSVPVAGGTGFTPATDTYDTNSIQSVVSPPTDNAVAAASLPVAHAEVMSTSTSTANTINDSGKFNDEPDIYVPPAPGSYVSSPPPTTVDDDEKTGGDESNNDNVAPSDPYEDLQARFANLKK